MEEENLLQKILDKVEDPTNLSLALLQKITGNFSEERKIGQGGFGEVYKGVLGEMTVAVKRIHINEYTVDDKLFQREFVSLCNTNHRNVVRFLGFCSNTYQKRIEHAGSKDVNLANIKERLLCLEYISNGSLDKHITDELRGLEWETRYEIVMGICKGLRYLHEEKGIIHMDLKPANILLDHQDKKYMVPKIADFGLSRPNKYSHTVGQCYGTRGYLAPEYSEGSKTTPMCDIYSLGAIIRELVTGCTDVPDQDNVLRRWRHRWNKPPAPLQYWQVTRCMELAARCREQTPEARPTISEIVNFLSESENLYGQISPSLDEDDMLGIKPLELRLPSELKKEVSCSIELTNGTRNCIAFNIQVPSSQYSAQPAKGIVQPGSMYVVMITVQARDAEGRDHADNIIMQSMKASEGLRYRDITECISRAEAGKVVDKVELMVIYGHTKPQENCNGREEKNTRVEEVVDKAEQRKIGESASRNGKLDSSENAGGNSMVAEMSLLNLTSMVTQETTNLLDIHPVELRFPFEPNKMTTCPLYLTNNRDHHVAFRLQPQRQRYYHEWLCGTIPPRSTYTLHVTMKERKKPPLGKDEILTILSSAINDDRIDLISKGKCENAYYNFFSDLKVKGIDKVHELKLKAVCDPQGATTTEVIPMSEDSEIFSMDVHATKPWIIISLTKAHFRIWNFETKRIVHKTMPEKEDLGPCDFWTSKFVARKQWIVAGGRDGCLHVYNYGTTTLEKVTSLKTHSERITCLAIHPTKSYVLAASYDFEIEMWDWEKDPKSARTFKGHTGSVCQIAFNPKDTNTFATVSEDRNIKIWSLNSPDPTITMKGHRSKVRCLDYFAHAGKQYLITGSDDKTAKIWDLQKKCCVRTLEGHTKRVSTVCSHPILPLLMTGSWDGTVRLWDSNSFRLKGVHNFGLRKVLALASIMDGTGRVLIGYNCGLAFLSLEDVASRSENTM